MKENFGFYFIILFLSNYPLTKEIEICKIGGKEHICGLGNGNKYMNNINVEFYTYCASFGDDDDYSCVCIQQTFSGAWNNEYNGYNNLGIKTYNSDYLKFSDSKCYIGRDCSDITDSSLCSDYSQCEYRNGKCQAKCSKHSTEDKCMNDNSCRVDVDNSRCTNSSILPNFKLILIIMISLFLN